MFSPSPAIHQARLAIREGGSGVASVAYISDSAFTGSQAFFLANKAMAASEPSHLEAYVWAQPNMRVEKFLLDALTKLPEFILGQQIARWLARSGRRWLCARALPGVVKVPYWSGSGCGEESSYHDAQTPRSRRRRGEDGRGGQKRPEHG